MFFHSLLTATDKDYRNISKKKGDDLNERFLMVRALRKNLAQKLTHRAWDTLQNGEPRHFSMTLNLRNVEKVCMACMGNHSLLAKQPWILECFSGNLAALDLVSKVIKGDLFDLGTFSGDCKDGEKYKSSDDCDKIFQKFQVRRYVKLLSSNIKELVKTHGARTIEESGEGFAILVSQACEKARLLSFTKARQHFKDTDQWVGTEFLPFISEQFNLNIFIISGETGLPYLQGTRSQDYSADKGSIFLLVVGESHYECIGFEVDEGDEKPKVRCKLAWDDENVRKCIALLSKDSATQENPVIAQLMYGDTVTKDIPMAEVDDAATQENGQELQTPIVPLEENKNIVTAVVAQGGGEDMLYALLSES